MRRTKFRKRLVTLVGALMLLGGTLAYALPTFETERVYYSGPDKELEVGGLIHTCYGSLIKWGKTTQWSDKYTFPCVEPTIQ